MACPHARSVHIHSTIVAQQPTVAKTVATQLTTSASSSENNKLTRTSITAKLGVLPASRKLTGKHIGANIWLP